MQDKELDKLFQSQLNDYEVEPSAGVWQGINEQLNAAGKKRSLMPFLSIAAAVILLVTAGILFIPKEVKLNNKPQNDHTLAKSTPAVKPKPVIIIAASPVRPVLAQNKNKHREVIAPVNQLAAAKKIKSSANTGYAVKQVNKSKETNANEQPVLASAIRGNDITMPVVPDNTTPLTTKQSIDVAPKFVSAPVAATITASTLPAEKQSPPLKKHRIRSFGDVLNVVIAAVDKRDKKVIQFSNTDGDDATITGVNFGIIKINKDK